jgi:hypothetical protein
MLSGEFEGLRFHCSDSEKLPDGLCRVNTGEQILQQYDVDPNLRYRSVGLCLGVTVCYCIVS